MFDIGLKYKISFANIIGWSILQSYKIGYIYVHEQLNTLRKIRISDWDECLILKWDIYVEYNMINECYYFIET